MFCLDLLVQKLGDRHPNTIELASLLVYVLCDFKAIWHQEASVTQIGRISSSAYLTRKNVLFPLIGIYLLLYPIYVELYGPFFTNSILIFNFAYIATVKPRICITTQLTNFNCCNATQIYEISSYSSHL